MQQHPRSIAKLVLAGTVAVAPFTLVACSDKGADGVWSAGDLLDQEGVEADAGVDAGSAFIGSYDSGFYEQSDQFVGEEVTVSATVDEIYDPNSFSIAGIEEPAAEPLLVVGSDIAGVLEDGQILLVSGTVRSGFDEVAVEGELGLDLPDGAYSDFADQDYIVAESVDIQVPAQDE